MPRLFTAATLKVSSMHVCLVAIPFSALNISTPPVHNPFHVQYITLNPVLELSIERDIQLKEFSSSRTQGHIGWEPLERGESCPLQVPELRLSRSEVPSHRLLQELSAQAPALFSGLFYSMGLGALKPSLRRPREGAYGVLHPATTLLCEVASLLYGPSKCLLCPHRWPLWFRLLSPDKM